MGRVISYNETDLIIDLVVSTLRSGGTVIFPTETVYGIGADIRVPQAIEEIFKIKRRSHHQPLLIHCGSLEQVFPLVKEIPSFAEPLLKYFWPGPLALIFYKSPRVPDIVVDRGEKVGIRLVDDLLFSRITQALGAPLAGTSANFSRQPPTNDFSKIPSEIVSQVTICIDGGVIGSGVSSTILDITVSPPRLLRQGIITKEDIEKVLGIPVLSLST